jgi:hypothetical protein
MDQSAHDHGKDQNGKDALADGVIQEVIPHGAVGKERYQIEKPQFRPPEQGDETHDPEANIGDEWNVMYESKPQDAISITS